MGLLGENSFQSQRRYGAWAEWLMEPELILSIDLNDEVHMFEGQNTADDSHYSYSAPISNRT